jgi:hypothetical protein
MRRTWLILTVILLFNVSKTISWTHTDLRDFVKSLFQTIKGKQWVIDDNCLAGNVFEKILAKLEEAISHHDTGEIFAETVLLLELEWYKCPVAEYQDLQHDFITSLRNGTAYKNFLRNLNLLKNKFLEYIQSDRSPCSLGNFVGLLSKVVVYGTATSTWKDEHTEHRFLSS